MKLSASTQTGRPAARDGEGDQVVERDADQRLPSGMRLLARSFREVPRDRAQLRRPHRRERHAGAGVPDVLRKQINCVVGR